MAPRVSRTGLLQAVVVGVGLLQALGFVIHSAQLEGLGWASMASPLPRVFTDRQGMEDFAQFYTIEWTSRGGATRRQRLTAREVQKIPGPFARRAAYVAAVAYAPRLPASLWRSALHYGFCENLVLTNALGEGAAPAKVVLELDSRTRERKPEHWRFSIRCDP